VNKYAKWFCIAMWTGIVVNLLLGLPTVLFPNTMMRLLHQRPSTDIVWTAFSANLLVLLSLLYIPGGKDPIRYRLTAKLSVFARLAGVIFFFLLWPGRYPLFGLMDGFFLIIQAPLLYLALKENDQHGASS
jgi:hypothetical protein